MIGAAPPHGKEWLVRHDGPTIPNLSRQEPGAQQKHVGRPGAQREAHLARREWASPASNRDQRDSRRICQRPGVWCQSGRQRRAVCCARRPAPVRPGRRLLVRGRLRAVHTWLGAQQSNGDIQLYAKPQRNHGVAAGRAEQRAIGLRQRSTHPIRDTQEHWFGEGQLASDVLRARAAGGCHRLSAARSTRRRRQHTNPAAKHDALQRVAGRLWPARRHHVHADGFR